ncbi:hypothetical protein [Actinocorallia populi]|uniref:hypothetical protein n=1 Tax=Actinocorallia populi TaxID=2079200 RepID=UPI000D08FDCA|nr:hypothetical protein [Actinocorallia populi]
MRKFLALIPLALAAPLVTAAPAAADDDVTCRGTITARSIDGNVQVPRGATCRLLGTRVDGDVKVNKNATLIARGVRVKGNIQAAKHKRVDVRPRGSARSFVDGNIQLERGKQAYILRTVVNGDIQLFGNSARQTVQRNVVDGNLQCKSNRVKVRGGDNRVDGNKEDQCRRL